MPAAVGEFHVSHSGCSQPPYSPPLSVFAFRPKDRPATYRDLDRLPRRPGCTYELIDGTLYITRLTPDEARTRDEVVSRLLEMLQKGDSQP